MDGVRVYLLLLVVVIAGMYFLYYKRGKNPLLVPGDIYKISAGRSLYIPVGAGLIITTLLYAILKLIF